MEDPAKNTLCYEFGPFRLDTDQRVLYREGQAVPLAPKVVETLLVLLERGGSLVTKDELMERLWPNVFVEESNLTQNVFLLRKALGDNGEIETVPRRGYRFRTEIRRTVKPGVVDELIFTSTKRTRIVREETTEDESEIAQHLPSKEPVPQMRTQRPSLAPPRSNRVRLPIIFGVAAVFVLAAGFGVVRLIKSEYWKNLSATTRPAAQPGRTENAAELKRLTYDSKAFDPVISPDGHSVAYKYRDGDQNSIRLKNIVNGSTIEVLPPTGEEYGNLAFSPDGSYIYLRKNASIVRAPIFGPTPQELVRDVWSSFALSPDGRQAAFIRGYNAGQEMRLLVADLDSRVERELARSTPTELWFAIWGSGPAWSPNGQTIVVVASERGPDGNYSYLLEVPVGGGSPRKIPNARWYEASQEAWLPDGTGLVVSAQEKSGAPYQLWLVSYPSGEMRRLTHDLNDYDKVSISPDSRLLVAQQETNVSHLWVMPIGDETRARQLTAGASDGDGRNGLAWTPEGRILFGSTRGGSYNIWTINADGADERQLTFEAGGTNWGPRASPDGRYIVFVSNRTGRENVWRMDADGSNPRRLTTGQGELSSYISPDGRWVYYTNIAGSYAVIDRVPIDGGEKQPVMNESDARNPVISPDGQLMAYNHFDDANGWRTAVVPTDGSQSPRLLGFHPHRGLVRWTSDSRSLVYIDSTNIGKMLRQPIAGGPPHPFASFATEGISYFDLSPDGNRLVVARGNLYSDVVLITNFR